MNELSRDMLTLPRRRLLAWILSSRSEGKAEAMFWISVKILRKAVAGAQLSSRIIQRIEEAINEWIEEKKIQPWVIQLLEEDRKEGTP